MSENHFLPFVRSGLAAGLSGPLVEAATVSIDLAVRAEAADGTDEVRDLVARDFLLHGPGSIAALTSGQVLTHEPAAAALDVETNMFASIDLASADLPWRFTPAGVPSDNRLRPWLSLIVVEQSDRNFLTPATGKRLATIQIERAEDELQSLHESWAWAHAHYEGPSPTADDLVAAMSDGSGNFRSRLLCPRRLDPNTSYWACVVPTFEAGRLAGLGELGETSIEDAWTTGAVELPIYYHWSFSTGERGDFESLVRRLNPIEIDGAVGVRELDISDSTLTPDPGLQGETVLIGGALVSPAASRALTEADARPTDAEEHIRQTLREAVNAGIEVDASSSDPVVAAPAYGRNFMQGDQLLPKRESQARWYSELNTRPQFRVVAGLASALIRDNQEEFVDKAWDAVGEAREAQRQIQTSSMAREVNRVAHSRLPAEDGDLLRFISPATHAMAAQQEPTVQSQLHQSAIPNGVFSGAFRRIGRPSTGVSADDEVHPAGFVVTAFLDDPTGDLGVYRDHVFPVGSDASLTPAPTYEPAPGPAPGTLLLGSPDVSSRPRDSFEANDGTYALMQSVRSAVDPDPAMQSSLLHRVPAVASHPNVLDEGLWLGPEFTEPMYERLRQRSADFVVPGIGDLEDDIVGLLVSNNAFIEAFMVGLNHEIAREFRWREFPTHLHHTWFRQFWNGAAPDIDPIDDWASVGRLGQHGRSSTNDLALVIKGALPKRFPQLKLYASKARWASDPGTGSAAPYRDEDRVDDPDVIPPDFAAQIGQDVFAFGFSLDQDRARGNADPDRNDAGYFFVFEQPVTAPRFGLEIEVDPTVGFGQAPSDWSTISWSAVTPADANVTSRFVELGATDWMDESTTRPTNGSGEEAWAEDAAAVARQTLQRPVRVLLHADAMLPGDGGAT